jgi:hypothetical protein
VTESSRKISKIGYWEAKNRLHDKGFISRPVGKAKSVVFTDDGERRSEALFHELFSVRR